MATNAPNGDGHRKGAVRQRSQTQVPNGNWVKRETTTGRFMQSRALTQPHAEARAGPSPPRRVRGARVEPSNGASATDRQIA